MLRQLTLDLGTPPPSTFDNFLAGANAELVTRLRELDNALAAGPLAGTEPASWDRCVCTGRALASSVTQSRSQASTGVKMSAGTCAHWAADIITP